MRDLIVFFVAAAFSLAGEPLFAQSPFWQATNGPNGGQVWSVMMDSAGFIFAGCNGGIFCTSDQGSTWRRLEVDAPLALAFAVNHVGGVYVCSLNGVLFSSDHGKTWLLMNDSLPVFRGLPPVYPSFIAIDSADNVFVGLPSAGVFYLPHGKTSWVQRNAGLPYSKATGIAISPTGTIVVVVDTSGLFRSTNQGLTWSRHSTGLTNPWVTSIACDLNGNFFVGTQGTLFRSTDDGLSWEPRGNGSTVPWATSIVARRGGWLLACNFYGGTYRSTDDGDSWVQIFDNIYLNEGWALEITRENKILFGSDLGLYRSTTADTSWELVGLPIARIEWMMAHSSGRLFAQGDRSRILYSMYLSYSTDRGESWLHNSLARSSAIVELRDGSILASDSDAMYRSGDIGERWEYVGNPGFGSVASFIVDSSGTVYAGTVTVPEGPPGCVYRSTDQGGSWAFVAALGPAITSFAINEAGHLFAVSSILFRSTDQGAHWGVIYGNGDLSGFAIAPDGSLLMGAQGYLSRSTDNGDTWNLVTTFGSTITSLYVTSDNSVYCGTAGLGVFVRRQNDSIFVRLQSGMTTYGITSLTVDRDRFLYAGTANGGVFRSTSPITSVERSSHDIPSAFILEQNHPNPFNPSTTIVYSLPHRSHITLAVFNVLGQQVAMLADGEVEAGYREVTFNAAGLASGVYFYRLQTPGFVQTRKLLLVR